MSDDTPDLPPRPTGEGVDTEIAVVRAAEHFVSVQSAQVLAAEVLHLRAELEQARAELEPYLKLAPQQCSAGVHAEWLIDSEHSFTCPWCQRDAARAELATAQAQLAAQTSRADRAIEPSGMVLIKDERQRQMTAEGWTPEHDDEHTGSELARAATCYATPPTYRQQMYTGLYADPVPIGWPWERRWWKPGPDRIRELVKAAALIAAEIDRLLRAGAR